MLIDDLRKLNIHLGNDKIRDAVVFRVNETLESFGETHLSQTIKDPLPSLLPYPNMVINYDGSLQWYLSKNNALFASCFFRANNLSDLRNNSQPHLVIYFCIDEFARNFTGGNIYYPNEKQFEYDNNKQRLKKSLLSTLSDSKVDNHILHGYGYLQAFLNILSCKNIKAELETPNEKIQNKRVAKGKLPLVSFYTLKIQNIGRDHESTQSGLWTNRIHFCRGHMREYTIDAPLFGRLVGRYWIPPHVRGEKKKGIIIKDYEVDPNNPQEK
jgi:hypothetical protein